MHSNNYRDYVASLTCDQAMLDMIQDNAATIGGIAGTTAFIGCVVILALICLWYDKKFGEKKDEEKRSGATAKN